MQAPPALGPQWEVEQHLLLLEQHFQASAYPSEAVQASLAQLFGVQPRQVHWWFQIRRSKEWNQGGVVGFGGAGGAGGAAGAGGAGGAGGAAAQPHANDSRKRRSPQPVAWEDARLRVRPKQDVPGDESTGAPVRVEADEPKVVGAAAMHMDAAAVATKAEIGIGDLYCGANGSSLPVRNAGSCKDKRCPQGGRRGISLGDDEAAAGPLPGDEAGAPAADPSAAPCAVLHPSADTPPCPWPCEWPPKPARLQASPNWAERHNKKF